MSKKYKTGESERPHFITSMVIDWVGLFAQSIYKGVTINALAFCFENKSLVVFAFSAISSPIHQGTKSASKAPSEILDNFKKFTSLVLVEITKKTGEQWRQWLLYKSYPAAKRLEHSIHYKPWQDRFYRVKFMSNKMMDQRLDDLHNNPVVEEHVHSAGQWVYSSAAFRTSSGGNRVAL